MEATARSRPWRIVAVPFVVAALLVGWLVYARSGAPARTQASAPASLNASDLLLAATRAKGGIFMSYQGVTGPPSSDHTNHAALRSFQFGVGRGIGSAVGGNRETSTPSVSEITVSKASDQYSAKLLDESLGGTGASVVIYFTDLSVKGMPVDYLEVDLDNTLLSGFSLSSGGDRPTESLSLNFTKFTFRLKLDGANDVVTYDLAQGKLG